MVYKRLADGTYEVKGTRSNWIVNSEKTSCNCPKFRFLLHGQSPCHHIEEVREKESAPTQVPISVGEFKKWCPAEYVSLLSEHEFSIVYGDLQLAQLITNYEVVVINNMVRIL